MSPVLHIDFETRSTADLREVGLYNYARHPHTSPWCLGFAIDEAEPQTIGGLALAVPDDHPAILEHVRRRHPVYAHNAAFEIEVWNQIMAARYGWPELLPEQVFCTMAMSYTMGLPGGLEDAARALGLDVGKDKEGRALMLRMSRPRLMDGPHPVWWDDPVKLERLYAYCRQDVRVERALHTRLRGLSETERKVWLMDYAVNQRGICVDVESARAGVALAARVKARCDERMNLITGGAVQACTNVGALKEWLTANGCPANATGLTKDAVTSLLQTDKWKPEVSEALRLRQEAGRASTSKLTPMIALAGADGRLRNTMQYHGANTGRWAGRGIQPHNFPRDVPNHAVVERVLKLVREGKDAEIDLLYDSPMRMLSVCLRGFLRAAPGQYLIVGDWSGIESRGGAWFAGEQWKLDAFRAADAKTGPGIYELAYANTFGVPVESVKNPSRERQIGKVQELAFLYQGGVGAARQFLPLNMRDTPDTELNKWKVGWRAAHPKVVRTWYALQSAAISAVQNPGEKFGAGAPGRQVFFKVLGSFLWCKLPSGRFLCYPYPKIMPGKFGDQLTYMTVPSPDKSDVIHDTANSNNWARVGTYGGSLMENVVQAICRDILAECLVTLHGFGAKIVLHVHDEIVIEVEGSKAEGARRGMEHYMRTNPAWAEGFPLWADCHIMERYGK